MSSDQGDFDRIVPKAPATGEVARATRAPEVRSASISGTTFAIGIAALVALGASAIFVLPRLVENSPPPVQHAPAATAQAPKKPEAAPPTPMSAPSEPAKAIWDDPAALQARADAQDAKARFEQTLTTLTGHAVDRWGKDALAAAQARADSGAAAFGAKRFPDAKQEYEAAANAAEQLLARMPQQFAQLLADGTDALARNDKATASGAFELAQAIEPGDERAKKGLARVQAYDAVRAKVDTAAVLERADDLPAAATAYQAALKLDPEDILAREGLNRVQATLADREFRRVLADAVAALDRGDYAGAESRLARARVLRANDPGVQQAQTRLSEARRTATIAGLQSRATTQVAAEDWNGAIVSYESALKQDANLAFAIEGLVRARQRADLAKRLQTLIDDPKRLYAGSVKADAESWLTEAQAIPSPGPLLKKQMTSVAQALAAASIPVRVSLRSDNFTDVTVFRIGTLGRFTAHDLDLKPGRYTAIGTRAGYRDVRKDFEVAPGTDAVVEVRCEETI